MFSPLPSLPAVSTAPAPSQAAAAPASEGSSASQAFARQLQAAQDQDKAEAEPTKRPSTPAKPARHATPASGSKARIESADTASSTNAQNAAGGNAASDAADPNATDNSIAGREATVFDAPTANEAPPQDLAALLAHLRGHSPVADATARLGTEPGAALDAEGRTGKGGKACRNGAAGVAPAVDPAAPKDTDTTTGHGKLRDAGTNAVTGTVNASFKEEARRALQEPVAGATAQGAETESPNAQPAATTDASSFSAALASATALASTTAGANSAASGTAPTQAQAQLPATPGSADFAPQLGAQISTFVRDGIEHAQLHLNPADMGPVTVQIQLDGQSAQVHLLADQAATRQALEQAMPQLASSLRDAGVTLTGGGVFQQPRQPGGEAGTDGRGNSNSNRSRGAATVGGVSTGGSALDSATRAAAQPRRRGVVDLVA